MAIKFKTFSDILSQRLPVTEEYRLVKIIIVAIAATTYVSHGTGIMDWNGNAFKSVQINPTETISSLKFSEHVMN